MKMIFDFVEKETKYRPTALCSKSRESQLVYARALFSVIGRRLGFSFAVIGKWLGGRDHTTIIHLVRRFGDEDVTKKALARYIFECGESVSSPKASLKFSGQYAWLHKKYGGKCMVCGFDEIVEVHHIKPLRAGGDNSEDNLVLLCPNHHALADRGMLKIEDINKIGDYMQLSTYPQV